MYKSVEVLIFERGLSKAEIATELGIGYNTFLLKLKGKNKFTLDEALKLKGILKTEKTVEELFSREMAS